MRTLRVGRHALLVTVDGPAEALAASVLVRRIAAEECGRQGGLAVPVEVIPAAATVLLDGLPDAVATRAWAERLASETVALTGRDDQRAHHRLVEIDMAYDGPDLDLVAAQWDCSREAAVRRHQQAEFVVAFCGFAPGFAYCTASPPLPAMPRRSEPRGRVPAGSVALAGEYCGVYPSAMPGGWQLIGATTAVLFDAAREKPALLTPGDGVRFTAV